MSFLRRESQRHRPHLPQPLSLITSLMFVPLFIVIMAIGTGWAAEETADKTFSLAPTEQAWLAMHPDIRLGVDIDWAPFEFVDEQNEYRGMAAEYILLVEKRLGAQFRVSKDKPWPEVVDAVKNRDLDAFSLVVQTPERDEYVNFTKPYISFPMVIVSLDDEPYIDGIDALRTRTVSVVDSYASHELLATNNPDIILSPSPSVQKGLEAVSNGQVYAFVGNLAVVSQVIRDTGITNLKVSGQTPYRFELRMAVRNDWPELIPILQKALDSISLTERDDIYNRWIRLQFEEIVDYRLILSVLGVGFLIITIILFWNRKLKHEVRRRQQVENELVAHVETEAILKATAEESELKIRTIIETVSDAIITTSSSGLIETFNPASSLIFGYSYDEVIGQNVSVIMPEVDKSQHDQYLEKSLAEKSVKLFGVTRELVGLRKNGQEFPISLTLNKMQIGDKTKFAGVIRDITDRKQVEEKIRLLAMTDPLTGLANRNQFNRRFEDAMAFARRQNNEMALLMIDLDKFKPINDTFGHPVGDALLVEVASILNNICRDTDTVARLGGDEFAVICSLIKNSVDVETPAARLVEKIQQPINIDGNEVQIGTSIGISIYPKDGEDIETLIRNADLALYRAKESGRNMFCLYHDKLDDR